MNSPYVQLWNNLKLCLLLLLGIPLSAPAQGPDPEWSWGVQGGLGYFNFRNSLFAEVEPDPPGNLSDDWLEFYVKPWAKLSWQLEHGTLIGGASWAYARTGEEAAEISGGGASSSAIDELYLGWESGALDGQGWTLGAGRYPYVLAHQFLLADGYADGGSRAGYWSNPRRAWKTGVLAGYSRGGHDGGIFWLERDERPESDTDTRITGANYEFRTPDDKWTLGATLLELEANSLAAQRDGARVWNLRLYTTPTDAPFTLEAEWVDEDNGQALQANAWYVQPYFTFAATSWQPTLYYRYAYFEGDNPDTAANENYDALFPGFYDWGSWWQGEIAGEYFLGNSNLKTHMVRVHLNPRDNLSMGLIWFNYALDQPGSYQGGVASDELGRELNWYMDWQFHRWFSASFVLARTDLGAAVFEAFERTEDLKYGMVYVNFSYE